MAATRRKKRKTLADRKLAPMPRKDTLTDNGFVGSNVNAVARFNREERLVRVAALYREGKTMRKISEITGVGLAQIHDDISKIREEWRDHYLIDFESAQAKLLARIEKQASEAWDSWHASRNPVVKTKTTINPATNTPTDIEVTEERSNGDPRFLATLAKLNEQFARTLGLWREDLKRDDKGTLTAVPEGAVVPIEAITVEARVVKDDDNSDARPDQVPDPE